MATSWMAAWRLLQLGNKAITALKASTAVKRDRDQVIAELVRPDYRK